MVHFDPGKLQKNHAGRQDNMTPYQKWNESTYLRRLAGFAKASRSQKNTQRQPFCSVLLHSCNSSTLAVKAVQTAAQPRLVIQGASSAVSSQPSRISPEPFTITKHQTAACLGLLQPPQRVFVLRSAARAGGEGVVSVRHSTANKQESHAG